MRLEEIWGYGETEINRRMEKCGETRYGEEEDRREMGEMGGQMK